MILLVKRCRLNLSGLYIHCIIQYIVASFIIRSAIVDGTGIGCGSAQVVLASRPVAQSSVIQLALLTAVLQLILFERLKRDLFTIQFKLQLNIFQVLVKDLSRGGTPGI